MTLLEDVRCEPASGQKPKQLVVFLHGIGVDGNDLIPLAPYYANRLPDALFIAPHAPEAYDIGRQWFDLSDLSLEALTKGVEKAAARLNSWLNQQLTLLELTEEQLVVIGFSQGTMTALHAILRRPRQIAALIGYSGALIAPGKLFAEIRSRPPTLLIHGADDDVVPAHNLELAEKSLKMLNVPTIAELRPALGHGIDEQGLAMGIEFTVDHLTPKK